MNITVIDLMNNKTNIYLLEVGSGSQCLKVWFRFSFYFLMFCLVNVLSKTFAPSDNLET